MNCAYCSSVIGHARDCSRPIGNVATDPKTVEWIKRLGTELDGLRADGRRMDWLDKQKWFEVKPRNHHVKRMAASVELLWLPEGGCIQAERAETVRQVIDKAMQR